MKKFEFTLKTVHKVREIRQEKESTILANLQADAEKAARRVAQIEAMRHEAIESYSRRLTSGDQLNATELELSSNHFASLDRLQRDAEVELRVKQHACLRQIELVGEAMRDVKITDKLRESQEERHQQEYLRQEQNSVDDMVSAKFARRLSRVK